LAVVLLDKPIDRFNIKNRFNPCQKTVIKTVLDNICDLIKQATFNAYAVLK